MGHHNFYLSYSVSSDCKSPLMRFYSWNVRFCIDLQVIYYKIVQSRRFCDSSVTQLHVVKVLSHFHTISLDLILSFENIVGFQQ